MGIFHVIFFASLLLETLKPVSKLDEAQGKVAKAGDVGKKPGTHSSDDLLTKVVLRGFFHALMGIFHAC